MPAPAVIPALLAYIEVDAVKKLVVGVVRVGVKLGKSERILSDPLDSFGCARVEVRLKFLPSIFYFEEIRVFKTGVSLVYFSMG